MNGKPLFSSIRASASQFLLFLALSFLKFVDTFCRLLSNLQPRFIFRHSPRPRGRPPKATLYFLNSNGRRVTLAPFPPFAPLLFPPQVPTPSRHSGKSLRSAAGRAGQESVWVGGTKPHGATKARQFRHSSPLLFSPFIRVCVASGLLFGYELKLKLTFCSLLLTGSQSRAGRAEPRLWGEWD